jgi:hypothetical protein
MSNKYKIFLDENVKENDGEVYVPSLNIERKESLQIPGRFLLEDDQLVYLDGSKSSEQDETDSLINAALQEQDIPRLKAILENAVKKTKDQAQDKITLEMLSLKLTSLRKIHGLDDIDGVWIQIEIFKHCSAEFVKGFLLILYQGEVNYGVV